MSGPFTPFPASTLYVETDLITGLADGDKTSPFVIPDYGTTGTFWGHGTPVRAFYYRSSGSPTGGAVIEQLEDVLMEEPFEEFYYNQLILPDYAGQNPDFQNLGPVLGLESAETAQWTLMCVMQPFISPNYEEPLSAYEYLSEWFGTSSAWGLGAYLLGEGDHRITLHAGYELVQFLEAPCVNSAWNYIEASLDNTQLRLRVNNITVTRPSTPEMYADIFDDGDNSIQWGDFPHHARWSLMQVFTGARSVCRLRNARRAQIAAKYGFTLTPEICPSLRRPFGTIIG